MQSAQKSTESRATPQPLKLVLLLLSNKDFLLRFRESRPNEEEEEARVTESFSFQAPSQVGLKIGRGSTMGQFKK